MGPKDIRKGLIDKDVRQADIARRLKVSASAVYLVVEGKAVSRRIREAIAEALDVPVEEIWPDAKAA